MKRYRRVLWVVLVNGLVLVIGFVAVELTFGAWLNPNKLNRLNLVKSQTFQYDVSALYGTATPLIRYSRDRYGLRGDYDDNPARIELLTVGGSTTDQRFVSDGDTWQDVLQKQFAAAGTPVVVANAGVDG